MAASIPRRSFLLRALPLAVAATALLPLPGCSETRRPDGVVGLLPVGATAPDLTGRDESGAVVKLSDFAGSPRVVYFYPKDETPGCTKEACAFRDAYQQYRQRGVVVFGVSRDSERSHDEFRKAHTLPFPLVADESGTAQAAFGVPARLGMAARVTFIVGRDGKVERVFEQVDPVAHAAEVLALIR